MGPTEGKARARTLGIGKSFRRPAAAGRIVFVQANLMTRAARRAFTLIELMVVLVLIAIMSAVIIPEMHGTFEDAQLRSTARQLVDAFTIAYSQAVTVNEFHRVRIEPKSQRYVVEKRSRDPNAEKGFVALRDIPGAQGTLDTRIQVEMRVPQEKTEGEEAEAPPLSGPEEERGGREEAIGFYPDGTADQREIRLRDRDGFGLLLRLNPVTARVQISELAKE